MQLIRESSAMGQMNLARLLDLQDEHAGGPTPDAALPGSKDLQDRTPTFSRADGFGSRGMVKRVHAATMPGARISCVCICHTADTRPRSVPLAIQRIGKTHPQAS
jgi:hypothetical protein